MPAKKKVKWACPQCGADANKHGKGGRTACLETLQNGDCSGFLCECEKHDAHGTYEDPCSQAHCYHCGWGGKFYIPSYDPKKLTGWTKTAYKAGWRPPPGWKP